MDVPLSVPSLMQGLFPSTNNGMIRGSGILTWLSAKAGLIKCSKPTKATISFQLKDFCDSGVTDLNTVLRVGFHLSFHAIPNTTSPKNEWIANYVTPVIEETITDGGPELNLEEAFWSSDMDKTHPVKGGKDTYSLELEIKALTFLFQIFQKSTGAVQYITLSNLHSRISNSCEPELIRYIGSSSMKRRQFIEDRLYIFNLGQLGENDVIYLQAPEVYLTVTQLAQFLLKHGGVTSSDMLFRFFQTSPSIPLPIRDRIQNKRSHFMQFLAQHPFVFAPFPAQFYVGVRRNLPYFDYGAFIRKSFPNFQNGIASASSARSHSRPVLQSNDSFEQPSLLVDAIAATGGPGGAIANGTRYGAPPTMVNGGGQAVGGAGAGGGHHGHTHAHHASSGGGPMPLPTAVVAAAQQQQQQASLQQPTNHHQHHHQQHPNHHLRHHHLHGGQNGAGAGLGHGLVNSNGGNTTNSSSIGNSNNNNSHLPHLHHHHGGHGQQQLHHHHGSAGALSSMGCGSMTSSNTVATNNNNNNGVGGGGGGGTTVLSSNGGAAAAAIVSPSSLVQQQQPQQHHLVPVQSMPFLAAQQQSVHHHQQQQSQGGASSSSVLSAAGVVNGHGGGGGATALSAQQQKPLFALFDLKMDDHHQNGGVAGAAPSSLRLATTGAAPSISGALSTNGANASALMGGNGGGGGGVGIGCGGSVVTTPTNNCAGGGGSSNIWTYGPHWDIELLKLSDLSSSFGNCAIGGAVGGGIGGGVGSLGTALVDSPSAALSPPLLLNGCGGNRKREFVECAVQTDESSFGASDGGGGGGTASTSGGGNSGQKKISISLCANCAQKI